MLIFSLIRTIKSPKYFWHCPVKLIDAREDKQDMLAKRVRIDDDHHSIIEYRKQQSLGEILAQLAAEHGFSFLRIAQSKFIRSSLSAKGLSAKKQFYSIY